MAVATGLIDINYLLFHSRLTTRTKQHLDIVLGRTKNRFNEMRANEE